MISVEEAISRITSQARSFGIQTVSIDDALGRVLVSKLETDLTYPPFTTDKHPADYIYGVKFSIANRVFTEKFLQPTSATPTKSLSNVFFPEVEEYIQEQPKTILKRSFITSQKEKSIGKNKWINDAYQSILAMSGHTYVKVEKLPEVAIISTGNEIVPADSVALPHQIRDSNSYTISSSLRRFGIHSPAKALVPDDKEALRDTITSLLDKDVLIISGGVSKGEADYVPEVLASLGVKELFHGVKIKPGAPFWFGRTSNGGVVFGLPGNPLALQVACRIFLEPYICTCFNILPRTPILLPLAIERMKKSKFDEFFPCRIVNTDSYSRLIPVRHNGSGDISAALQSDGIALQGETYSHLPEGIQVPFYVW
jgi:molybdopterin molybdotransferase